jgi:LuxR family transcriptional regulator, maltose regulon positive regulatory protein
VLAGDRPNQAPGQLEHLHAWEIARAGMGNLIEIQALRALAAGGKHTAALAALAEALTLAHPQGYFRILAYEGAPMAVLLPVFDTTHAEPHPGKGDASAMPVMIAPLTARELEVLALLAAGRSNQRIATELVVTLDTVKKHVGHILDKLGAANRTEAAARARQLGLIG